MTERFTDETDKKLRYFLMEIPEAVALAYDLFYLTHFWDDLVDGDVPRSVEDIELALRKQWVDIPGNRFFQVNEMVLRPMLARVALLWMDSNKLESGDANDKFIAFNIRCDLVKVIHTMIILVGGPAWAQEVGIDFWRTFGPNLQDYYSFLAEKNEIEGD